MKATWLYRIATVLLVLFALGHTFGFLHFRPPTPEGVAVHDAMNNVHFQVRGENLSYGGFYVGFGLFVTAYLLFAAFLAWYLAGLVGTAPRVASTLGWGLFAVQVASLVLSFIYFAGPPTVLSGVLAACLGWAAWIVQGAKW
jgi:hypothetical protein